MINKRRLALTIAILATTGKVIWTLLIALFPGFMQTLLNWLAQIGSIQPVIKITPVTLVNAIVLILLCFIVAYVIGFVFAALFNRLARNHK